MFRRTLLKGLVGAGAVIPGAARADLVTRAAPLRRIAVEEGFSIPELVTAVRDYMVTHSDEPGYAGVRAAGYNPRRLEPAWPQQLVDLDSRRIADMDSAGIDAALLLVGAPGVQMFDAVQAGELARLINDRAAEAMTRHPQRLFALAAVAPQDPQAAAQEFERAVRTLGMSGAVINSHTKGTYLDETRYWPIFEAAVALDRPVYIHPREPSPEMIGPYLNPAMVAGALWGYAAETGLHAVRLIFSGVFDQFPTLQIVLGHGGEALPYFMDRLDVRYREEGVAARVVLKKKPSDYIRENFHVTSSGMNWAPAIEFCQRVLGTERVLFAADYPFEDAAQAVRAAEAAEMRPSVRAQFFQSNAERLFRIPPLVTA